MLVTNKVHSKSGMNVPEVEKVLGVPSIASIESDPGVVLAMNQGIPLVLGAPRCQASKQIWNVAEQIGLASPDRRVRSLWRKKPR